MKLSAACFLFCGIIAVFCIANPTWFFDGEDYGLVLKAAQCTTWHDIYNLLVQGKVVNLSLPMATANQDACAHPPESFFSVYYRPLLLFVHHLQYHIFGTCAYAYFVFIIIMHAAIATLLFIFLCLWVRSSIAALCSLYFAFHPTLYGWLGKIDTQQHQLVVFISLLTILSLIRCIHHKKWWYYALFSTLFLLSLLIRETVIVLPIIILLGGWELKKINRNDAIVICLASFLSIGLYFCLRAYAYPPHFSSTSLSLLATSTSCTQIVRFFYDLFWLAWFPWTTYVTCKQLQLLPLYTLAKLLIASVVMMLFITNSRKTLVLCACASALCLYWPLLITPYGGLRFSYESLPLCAIALALLLHHSSLCNYIWFRRTMIVGLFCLIMVNAYVVCKSMRTIMKIPQKTHAALMDLKKYSALLHNKPLLVLNAPKPLHAIGIIQAIQLYGISSRLPQYFFRNIAVQTIEETKNLNGILWVQQEPSSIRLISNNIKKVWFEIVSFEPQPCYIKQVIVHQKDDQNRINDLSIVFEKAFFHPELTVLIWLFEYEKLLELFQKEINNGLF